MAFTPPPAAPDAPPPTPNRSVRATFHELMNNFLVYFTPFRTAWAAWVTWWTTFNTEMVAAQLDITTKAGNAGTAASDAGSARDDAQDARDAAQAAAANATNAANVAGTSTSSVLLPTTVSGSLSFTYVEANRTISLGMYLQVADTANPTLHNVTIQVTAWNAGTKVVTGDVVAFAGAGTYAAWTLSLTGKPGSAGSDATVSNPTRVLSANSTITVTDAGKLLPATAATTQTVDSAAALGGGFALTFLASPYVTTLAGGISAAIPICCPAILSSDGTTVRLSVFDAAAGDHFVKVETGNGFGSTNTVIRRYTTLRTNTGTAVTYADDAALGASFTINEPGLYLLTNQDFCDQGQYFIGASVNSTQLTSAVNTITAANKIVATTGWGVSAATTAARLVAGDVVRPHEQVGVTGTTNIFFSIRKIGA